MLEPAQEDLLLDMVDAARAVPRAEQQWHLQSQGAGAHMLSGPWGSRPVLLSDVSALREHGLLEMVSANYVHGSDYVIKGSGFFTAEAIRHERSSGFAGQEADARRLLESEGFRRNYAEAFERWSEADQALRLPEPDLTTVGHKGREAMQEFARALVERYGPVDADPNPAHVNRRLGAVIAHYLPQLGEARARLLKALGAYSEATIEIIQRQEHGGQKEGHPLMWADGRRVVFHVAAVMYEFAATIEEAHSGSATAD
jgi:hypothetical protein